MRQAASMVHRSTRPSLRRTVTVKVVVITAVLLSLGLAVADARRLHYHRKHRRHHHHGHHGHISQPPEALPPDADSPAEPPSLPPDVDDAPPPRSRHDRPCPQSHPPSKPPASSPSPVSALKSPAPAKPPAFSVAKPPSPSPAKAPLHSHAKPPALPPAEPPTFPRAKPPVISPARPPPFSHAKAPSPHPHAKPPSFAPSKPPTFSPAQPPRLSPEKPPAHAPAKAPTPLHPAIPPVAAKPPSFAPAKPPSQSPAQPPRLPSAKPPPPHAPAKSPPPLHHAIPPVAAKPPSLAPAKPPALSLSSAQPPRLSPSKPPAHAPAKPPQPQHPAIPPAEAKPPVLPPDMTKGKPPSAIPPASPAAKNCSAACTSVFDVRAFGASGNGSCADDTRAFRAAWKAACSAESATLLVPSDGVFTVTSTVFAGPCKPGLTFQIDGVLMPPDGPASWPAADSRRQWITFYKTDGMTLTGTGTIEGNGEEWWNLPCKPHRGPNGSTLPGPCDSPALIRFFASKDVTVRGLRIENSPQFHLKFDACDRVRVNGVFVSSPAFSPNTDGIHVENTRNVQIYNSRINNGDDCVSIGAGCSNIHIENVTCGHGHGISIGSLGVHNTRACVSNVTVRNARILDSDNGLRIKTWQGGAGAVSAVEFAGVRMENVKNCIVIDQYYCLGSGCANQTSAVQVAGVTYRDIHGTYTPQARGGPVRFACSDSVACTDITMTDVELLPAGGSGGSDAPLARPYCWNAYGVMATLTVPPVNCLQEGRPESLQDQFDSCLDSERKISFLTKLRFI